MPMPPPERIGEDAIEPIRSRLLSLRPWLLAAAAALVLGTQGPGAPSGPALLDGLLPKPAPSAAEDVVSSSPSPAITSVASPIAATPTAQRTSGEDAVDLGTVRSRL